MRIAPFPYWPVFGKPPFQVVTFRGICYVVGHPHKTAKDCRRPIAQPALVVTQTHLFSAQGCHGIPRFANIHTSPVLTRAGDPNLSEFDVFESAALAAEQNATLHKNVCDEFKSVVDHY